VYRSNIMNARFSLLILTFFPARMNVMLVLESLGKLPARILRFIDI
jgi:hypothetical protein